MAGPGTEVVIGVDIGTTSTKAVAFDREGHIRAAGQAGYSLANPQPEWEEQDPDEVAGAASRATAEAARAARDAGCLVAGLGFSSAMHSLIGLDTAGSALTPSLTWADGRGSRQARDLRDRGGAIELQRRTGTPVHPMSPLVKLRWFAEEQAQLSSKVAKWVGIKEYVLARLTGELVVDRGIASATGLYSLAEDDWDGEALEVAAIDRRQLPDHVPTTTALGLSAQGAAETGLPEGTPVVVGSGDGPLANLGLGAIRPGAVACSIGTSGAVRVIVDAPRVDERGRAFCYLLAAGLYAVGGAVNNGGVVLDWAAEALAPEVAAEADEGEAAAALLELAQRSPAGSGGLLFLPYLLGERAPHWQGRPRGVFLGVTRAHRREHLLRAAVEGVSLQLAVVLRSLEEAGVAISEVRATGGFSRSPLWRAVLAAAFGRPLAFAESPEASSLGAALLALSSLDRLDSLDRAAEIVTVDEIEEPEPELAELYARLLPIFDDAFEALGHSFETLADMQDTLPIHYER